MKLRNFSQQSETKVIRMTGGYRWKKDRCSNCGKGVVSPVSRTIQAHWCKDENGEKYWRNTVQGSQGSISGVSNSFHDWLTKVHTHEPEIIDKREEL